MKVLTLSNSDIQKTLPYEKLIPHMKQALANYSSETYICPPRNVLRIGKENALGYMPSFSEKSLAFGAKLAAVFPGNTRKNVGAHQGVVMIFDSESGQPQAILNASAITALRTAATSAAATDLLANKEATRLAVFGYGVQAKEHIKAIRTIRDISTLKVHARSEVKEDFPDIELQYCRDIEAAIEDCEIICLCTSARSPYLSSRQLASGIHLNAIGACRPDQAEISIESQSGLSVFVDSRESTSIEAREINSSHSHMVKGEVGEVFSGTVLGRISKEEITIFKSVGLGVQDLFAAQLAVEEARQMGLGTEIDL